MSDIQLDSINNHFLRSVHLEVRHGHLFVIVGPSGAGKTTLLRVIAGLVRHDGEVLVDGEPMTGVPPHLRKIGYVSQDLHLFPHLTLEGNLLIAMERLRLNKKQKRAKALELMKMLRIETLMHRKPSMLSGGEKQRAALARALASGPRILLLDEPFSKLDFRTSMYLRNEFHKLQKQMELTTILVTHNMAEARDMGDDLAVMQGGRLDGAGVSTDPMSFTDCPGDSFLEKDNLLACYNRKVVGNGLVEVDWAGWSLFIPDEGRDFSHVSVSPSKILIDRTPPPGSPVNRFEGIVRDVTAIDGMVRIVVDVHGEGLRVELGPRQWEHLRLAQGEPIHGLFRLQALHVH